MPELYCIKVLRIYSSSQACVLPVFPCPWCSEPLSSYCKLCLTSSAYVLRCSGEIFRESMALSTDH